MAKLKWKSSKSGVGGGGGGNGGCGSNGGGGGGGSNGGSGGNSNAGSADEAEQEEGLSLIVPDIQNTAQVVKVSHIPSVRYRLKNWADHSLHKAYHI